jgi:hypothetical protein
VAAFFRGAPEPPAHPPTCAPLVPTPAPPIGSPNATAITPQAYQSAAGSILASLADAAPHLPADSPMTKTVNSYVAAAKQVPGRAERCKTPPALAALT